MLYLCFFLGGSGNERGEVKGRGVGRCSQGSLGYPGSLVRFKSDSTFPRANARNYDYVCSFVLSLGWGTVREEGGRSGKMYRKRLLNELCGGHLRSL